MRKSNLEDLVWVMQELKNMKRTQHSFTPKCCRDVKKATDLIMPAWRKNFNRGGFGKGFRQTLSDARRSLVAMEPEPEPAADAAPQLLADAGGSS